MDINVRRRSQVEVMRIRGPIRMGTGLDAFREALEQSMADQTPRMLLDLSEVPMMDSSGIGVLVRYLTMARQRGGNVKLLNPSRFVMQTLRMVGLLNLFDVYQDEEEGAASFA
jgi:anti-sigma B factor antagonist